MSQGVKEMYFLNNRYNRQLDTYVLNGIVMTCGHRDWEDCECDGMRFAGKTLRFAYEQKGLRLEDHVR